MKLRLLFFLLFIPMLIFGQSPYEVHWKKEIPFIAVAAGSLGFSYYARTLPPLFTPDELLTLNPADINGFDRIAVQNYSEQADHNSDIFWNGSHLFPFLFLGGKTSRSHFGQVITMYGEAAVTNLGLTIIIKSFAKRPRPYVFNNSVPDSLKLNDQARASFLSGHSSMTAVNCFFMAKVFSDFYPDSQWKPVVWGAAFAIPAVTAYLRVKAGRHYPTDVIAGYALGATIGLLVPQLHRNSKLNKKEWSLQAGMNSASLTWHFNRPHTTVETPFLP